MRTVPKRRKIDLVLSAVTALVLAGSLSACHVGITAHGNPGGITHTTAPTAPPTTK